MEEIRIVVVGDEKSGKSTLINRFIKDSLPASYKPTSFDKFLVTREISGSKGLKISGSKGLKMNGIR